MSSVVKTLPVNKITFWDLTHIFFALLPARECQCFISVFSFKPSNANQTTFVCFIAVVLTWALLKAPFTPYGRAKSWKRILSDRLLLLVVTGTNRKQTRAIFGPTRGSYDNFMNEAKLTPLVEDIQVGDVDDDDDDDDAKLLWIGPRVTENVLLYFHGV